MIIKNYLKNYLLFFALIYIGFALVGIVKNYSPVPYWDMWNGYLDFYSRIQEGQWYLWFAQHNEHRIVLSRILFWIDIDWFKGNMFFLFTVHVVLLGLLAYLFSKIVTAFFTDTNEKGIQNILFFSIIVLTFSWVQEENITWAFQSQFFLASLMPLASFYFLARHQQTKNIATFYLSLLFAVLSSVTMANGLLALPLLLILSLVYRLSYLKSTVILLTTATTLFFYFQDYHAPANHGSLGKTLLHHPVEFFQYIFTYLGGPYYHAFTDYGFFSDHTTIALTQFLGAVLVFATLFLTFKALTTQWKHPMIFALITFLAYIGGTAFGTASGRAIFGIHQALASRYSTPALMAWIALSLLVAYYIISAKRPFYSIRISLVLIPLALLPYQLKTLDNNPQKIFERNIAALAIEMDVRDEEYLTKIFPSADWLLNNTKSPKAQNLSIFGNVKIKDVEKQLGAAIDASQAGELLGHLDEITPISDATYRIRGWAYDTAHSTIPETLLILNEKKNMIGYALTGMPRPDVKKAIDPHAKNSGFIGYIKKHIKYSDTLYLFSRKHQQMFSAKPEVPPFSIHPLLSSHQVASNANIQSNSYQPNGTYDKQQLPGYAVFGSYINGDTFTGSVVLSLDKRENVVYKTGPVSTNQFITIREDEKVIFKGYLPMSEEWKLLVFDPEALPEKLHIEISDEGSQWGEWSAIAVRSAK